MFGLVTQTSLDAANAEIEKLTAALNDATAESDRLAATLADEKALRQKATAATADALAVKIQLQDALAREERRHETERASADETLRLAAVKTANAMEEALEAKRDAAERVAAVELRAANIHAADQAQIDQLSARIETLLRDLDHERTHSSDVRVALANERAAHAQTGSRYHETLSANEALQAAQVKIRQDGERALAAEVAAHAASNRKHLAALAGHQAG